MRRTTLSLILAGFAFVALESQLWAHGDDAQGGRCRKQGCCDGTGQKNPNCQGAGNPFDAYTGNSHREVKDLEVWGGVGEHQLVFFRHHNTRLQGPESRLGQQFGTAGNWRHEYQWGMFPANTTGFTIYYPDGTQNTFHPLSGSEFASTPAVRDRLFRRGDDFFLQRANGFRYRFRNLANPGDDALFQMLDFRDSQQNLYTLTYTTDGRLIGVAEPAGRFLILAYATVGDLTVISSVSTSDGRNVSYTYDVFIDGVALWVRLLQANYGDETTALYTYSQPAPGDRPLLAHAVDPRFEGPAVNMRFEYSATTPGFISKERNGLTGDEMVSLTITDTEERVVKYANGKEVVIETTGRGNPATELDGLEQPTEFAHDQHGSGFLTAKRDALGRLTTLTNTVFGNLLSRTYPDGSMESWKRDELDLITSHIDELNRVTAYTREPAHRITRIDYPDGGFELFEYNHFGQVLMHRRRNGGVEEHVYDPRGLKVAFIDAEGHTTIYGYDSADRLASVTDPLIHTTIYEYNERGLVTTLVNPAVKGRVTARTFTYDDFGNQTSASDELLHTWSTAYDEFNRVKSVTDPLGRVKRFEYDLPGGVCGCQHAEDKPTKIILPSGKAIEIKYDVEWQKTSETVGFGTPDAATTEFGYDDVGNLTSVTDPRGFVWTAEYDDRDRPTLLTDPLGNEKRFAYDVVGNLRAVKRPDAGITINEYDSMNRLTQITDPLSQPTLLDHDTAGNLLSLTDPRGNLYSFEYDRLNRRRAIVYPDLSREELTYDGAGNLETYSTRAGQTRTYHYDERNRETEAVWDVATPAIQRTYDDASRVLTITSTVSKLVYAYDEANQLRSESQDVVAAAAPAKTVSYGYDLDGNPLHMTYPDQATHLAYAYTSRNQLAAIGAVVRPAAGSAERPTWTVTYSYDLNGNRVFRRLLNGTAADYVYDDANRMLSINHARSGIPLALLAYDYDSVDRRKFVKRDASRGDVFRYDPVDQLTAVQYDALSPDTSPSDPLRIVEYLYDTAGNRSRTTDSGSATRYLSNSLNQYVWVERQEPTYDANGNLATHDGWAYEYDAQNRLTSARKGSTSISFAYDARDRCMERTTDGVSTFFYYDGWSLLEERDALDTELARYMHGALVDEIVAVRRGSVPVYYHHDSIGNVILLTDSGGQVVERYAYDVFGAPTVANATGTLLEISAVGNRFLFTGREFNRQLGVYDFRYRMYSPALGRFMQPDPLLFEPGDTNLYRYTGNGPSNYIDPLGVDATGNGGGVNPGGHAAYNPPKVYLNSATANLSGGDLAASVGKYHQWISIDSGQSAGMGNKMGNVPGERGQKSPDIICSPTVVVGHEGRRPEIRKEVKGVDIDALRENMRVGQKTGPWIPFCNDCNTWAARTLTNSTPGAPGKWGLGGAADVPNLDVPKVVVTPTGPRTSTGPISQ